MKQLNIGSPTPQFKGKAFPTKRSIEIPDSAQTPTLLVFVNYKTAPKIEEVILGVRHIVPNPERLRILIVIDLNAVPGLMRDTVEGVIRSAYDKAAAQVPEPYDPADQLMMFPDWKGKLFKLFAISDVGTSVAVIYVDANGIIADRYQGGDPTTAAMEMIRPLYKPS